MLPFNQILEKIKFEEVKQKYESPIKFNNLYEQLLKKGQLNENLVKNIFLEDKEIQFYNLQKRKIRRNSKKGISNLSLSKGIFLERSLIRGRKKRRFK